MKVLKNIFVGFIVSFVGSIPLGYLNIIGCEIHTEFGLESLVLFLLGVIFVEAFVIYFTLVFAHHLVNNKKLVKAIDVFGVFFLLFLAFSFHSLSNHAATSHNYLEKYIDYSPFLIGLILSCLNFLQIPFWSAWNLYLIKEGYIVTTKNLKLYYLFGTLLGTFFGMFGLVFFLNSISNSIESFSKYLLPVIIPIFFIVMACFQGCKVFKKYRN